MHLKVKKPYKNLVGERFGKLTVVSLVEDLAGANVPTRWLCKCDCGEEVIVRGYNLKSGQTTSCGCFQKEDARKRKTKHGCSKTRLFNIWQHMKKRCFDENNCSYKHYGARGIRICNEWKTDFVAFRDWAIANGYRDDLTIDRVNNDGDYEPSNCRWVTHEEQQRNKRNNVYISFNGEIKLITEWAKELECDAEHVYRTILEKEGRVVRGTKRK